jgi:hypothetical protein
MKMKLLLSFLAAGCLLFSVVAVAGTLENTDESDYRYELIGTDGMPILNSIIYGESVLYGLCDDGCRVRLLDTGQTITMGPNDDIVIEDGVLKPKEE